MIDNDGRNELLQTEGHEVLEYESGEGLREGQDQIPRGEDSHSHEAEFNELQPGEVQSNAAQSSEAQSDEAESNGAAYAWSSLYSSKYPQFSMPGAESENGSDLQDKFPGQVGFQGQDQLPGQDKFLSEEDVAGHRQIVSGIAASNGSSYPHFDLLPDTSVSLAASLDFEVATGRPAWLLALNPEDGDPNADAIPFLHSPGEHGATRWFALKHMFRKDDDQQEPPAARAPEPRVPCLAVFSMAGGVGKTSLVATLGRALSAYGERMLLVDTASSGLLPFYFGARDLRPGVVRTFMASGSTDAPVNMVSLDPEYPHDTNDPHDPHDPNNPNAHNAPKHRSEATPPQADHGTGDRLVAEINGHSRGASRVLIDLATASGPVARRLLKLAPTVLVLLTPEMNSVVSLNAIESLFRSRAAGEGRPIQPYYLINQFDPSLALHLDVREVMRQQLGDRLLPFTLRRNSAVSEALAQGMTVVDYAPNSPIAEDYMTLAGWMRSIASPAMPGYRGVRWSERTV